VFRPVGQPTMVFIEPSCDGSGELLSRCDGVHRWDRLRDGTVSRVRRRPYPQGLAVSTEHHPVGHTCLHASESARFASATLNHVV